MVLTLSELTLEEDNRVCPALSTGTLNSRIQVRGDSGELLLDRFGIPVLQGVVVIAEHFVILEMITETWTSRHQ